MLDKNKVYVIVFKEDETGHISRDDPRVPPYLAANAFIEEFRGKMCLSYPPMKGENAFASSHVLYVQS